jgi:hypothetical protein|eukprot:SAG25_NODE_3_length_30426_cov_8.268210_17_plen_57_part_00
MLSWSMHTLSSQNVAARPLTASKSRLTSTSLAYLSAASSDQECEMKKSMAPSCRRT